MERATVIKTFLITFIVTLLMLPVYKKTLLSLGFVQSNYQEKEITISYGIFILLVEWIVSMIYPEETRMFYWLYLLLIAIVGTYDDWYGDRTIKGLSGHLKALLHGHLTSGFIKATVGGGVSFYIGVKLSTGLFDTLLHTFIIALMMNTMNVFDVRPGRMLKVFFILFFGLSVSTFFYQKEIMGLILFSILLVVFFHDVHAKIMVGDSGANLIGFQLGIWISLYSGFLWKIVMLIILIYLHIYIEKYSISKWIDKHQIIKRIDLWGRKGIG